jgi:hypothetical protein
VKLEKGHYVRIFQKPLTIEDFEGVATLIKKISEDELSETWKVKFDKERKHSIRKIAKYQDLDFDQWKVNMTVVLRNLRADVRLEDQKLCPGAINNYGDSKIENGDCDNCYFYMGCNTDEYSENNPAYPGNTLRGCCWKLLLIEKGILPKN